MFDEIDVPVRCDETPAREEIRVHPLVRAEERELLERLEARAPTKRGWCVTLPIAFVVF